MLNPVRNITRVGDGQNEHLWPWVVHEAINNNKGLICDEKEKDNATKNREEIISTATIPNEMKNV